MKKNASILDVWIPGIVKAANVRHNYVGDSQTSRCVEEREVYDIIWDLKTCRILDADKMLKFSMQLELYRRFNEKMKGKATQVGGVIWYPDFVENPDPAPQIERPLPLGNAVDELLNKWAAALDTARKQLAA